MSTKQDETRVRFLATLEIGRRELIVLEYSATKLFSATIDVAWVNRLTDDMAVAETLEAFVSRFGRLQDTLGDKLIPRALLVLLERPGSMIDNLSRAEQFGWIDNVEDWVAARELRNRLIHEYVTDPEQFAFDIRATGGFVGMFRRVYTRLVQLAQERFGVSEENFQAYLLPKAD